MIISSDTTNSGAGNGYYFKLGNMPGSDPKVWELVPGSDLTAYPAANPVITTIAGKAYVVGVGVDDTGTTAGQAQDLGVFSGVIALP